MREIKDDQINKYLKNKRLSKKKINLENFLSDELLSVSRTISVFKCYFFDR